MLELSEALKHRYAVKQYDPNFTIPAETVEKLKQSLRLCPSSINSQPWHFIFVSTAAGKERILASMQDMYASNASKVEKASLTVVLCTRLDLTDAYLERIIDQESSDGRYENEQSLHTAHQLRKNYLQRHKSDNSLQVWMQKQTYIALGSLLISAALLDIDATPIEGFSQNTLDTSLQLVSQGITSQVIVTLGRRAQDDSHAKRPKSRLPEGEIFSNL